MIQEEVEEKTVNLAITSTKLSMKSVITGLKAYVSYEKEKSERRSDSRVKGKQSVKDLVGQNQGVTSIPVTDGRIKDLDKIAKKFGVDYAVIRNRRGEGTDYTVFFKARDSDVLEEIIKEYTKRAVATKERLIKERKPERILETVKSRVVRPELKERSR